MASRRFVVINAGVVIVAVEVIAPENLCHI